jgi:ATP-binding cassette, subfamily B, bacterial
MFINKFKFFRQLESMDCGPTCLKMISNYHGKNLSLAHLRELCHNTRNGVNLSGIKEAASLIGFNTVATEITFDDLASKAPLPCIIHWRQNHFVVLLSIRENTTVLDKLLRRPKHTIKIADPAHGIITVKKDSFLRNWINPENDGKGIALLFEKTENFALVDGAKVEKQRHYPFTFLKKYLSPYKRDVAFIVGCMLIGSVLNMLFPILTQRVVDYGIRLQDIQFIYLIFISQIFLLLGSTAIEVVKSWMLLYVNARISITILSDFLIKLMKLPLRYFDTNLSADIIQRVGDQSRIQNFLTSSFLETLFSAGNFIVFSLVLWGYSSKLFGLFALGSLLSIFWIVIFLKKRAQIDYSKYDLMNANNNSLIEMIVGMPEIKLNNSENSRRWAWEKTQVKLFNVNSQSLRVDQYQQIGNALLSQFKGVVISVIAAIQVVNGELTLGAMLSISFIVGQLNGAIGQLVNFVRSAQDAKISLDRMSEIHEKEEEDSLLRKRYKELDEKKTSMPSPSFSGNGLLPDRLFHFSSIDLQEVSFQYDGLQSPFILKNLTLAIPAGKTTAIVGTSGSGKSTLMKLLLKFYEPQHGTIGLDEIDFRGIGAQWWRSYCGVVMQDGYIFSDTIANNIGLSADVVEMDRLEYAAKVANIYEFIMQLPLGFQTKIGSAGSGLSVGQKQRLLIARAVYKDPQIIFFDEATSALDANNEKVIMENLTHFLKGKTVVVIAHRLSTVKNADQIVVLENGHIKEIGCHETLTERRGDYYNLVKNQLELGQ